jgi:hypothetical protein
MKTSVLVVFILIDENFNPLVKMLQHGNHGETTLMNQSLTISLRIHYIKTHFTKKLKSQNAKT